MRKILNTVLASEEALSEMLSSDGEVDFSKHLPIDSEQGLVCEKSCGTCSGEGGELSLSDLMRMLSDDDLPMSEIVARQKKASICAKAKDKIRKAWGTQSNAWGTVVISKEELSFCSEDSSPLAYFESLSKRLGLKCLIQVTYVDLHDGKVCGAYWLRGGKIICSEEVRMEGARTEGERASWSDRRRSLIGEYLSQGGRV